MVPQASSPITIQPSIKSPDFCTMNVILNRLLLGAGFLCLSHLILADSAVLAQAPPRAQRGVSWDVHAGADKDSMRLIPMDGPYPIDQALAFAWPARVGHPVLVMVRGGRVLLLGDEASVSGVFHLPVKRGDRFHRYSERGVKAWGLPVFQGQEAIQLLKEEALRDEAAAAKQQGALVSPVHAGPATVAGEARPPAPASPLTVMHADERRATGVKDGLELIVSTVVRSGVPQPILECSLHNTTDQDIPFDLSGPTDRLSFKLLDASGAEIPMDAEWKRLNAWGDDAPYARHASAVIKPEASRVYAFRPSEAYGERWKSGRRLVVSWEPGIDWSTEKPHTRGRGLSVEFDVEAAAMAKAAP